MDLHLPDTRDYLRELEGFCRVFYNGGFPCVCQESSLILWMWLKNNGIDCEIIAGDHYDPVIEFNSIHFWIETSRLIIDGTAIQFELPNYDRGYFFEELSTMFKLNKYQMVYKKTNKKYLNKVPAYISPKLNSVMEFVLTRKYDAIGELVESFVEKILITGLNLGLELKYTMFSSLYKNNQQYYDINNLDEFLDKCKNKGTLDASNYIFEY